MNIEDEIREAGFDKQIVIVAFRFKNLQPDFIREVVEYDQSIKKELEHELAMDIHQYSVHASAFYQNMFIYLKLNLAEQKDLKWFTERVGQMYMNQLQQEQESRQIYSFVDGTGRIQDQIVY